jgi:hypothetical protein
MSSTGTYVRAGVPEVAAALAVLTDEPHPLALRGSVPSSSGTLHSPRVGQQVPYDSWDHL